MFLSLFNRCELFQWHTFISYVDKCRSLRQLPQTSRPTETHYFPQHISTCHRVAVSTPHILSMPLHTQHPVTASWQADMHNGPDNPSPRFPLGSRHMTSNPPCKYILNYGTPTPTASLIWPSETQATRLSGRQKRHGCLSERTHELTQPNFTHTVPEFAPKLSFTPEASPPLTLHGVLAIPKVPLIW